MIRVALRSSSAARVRALRALIEAHGFRVTAQEDGTLTVVDGEPSFDEESYAGEGHGVSEQGDVPSEALTPREREVLDLVSRGLSNREIARRLGISVHTAKFHLSTIYSKLDVTNRAEAVSKGVRRGLIAV